MQVQGAARLSARIGVRGYEVQLMKAAKTGIRVTIALIVIVFGSMIYNYRSQNEFYEEFQDMRESLTHFYRDYSPSKLQDVEGMKKAFERVEKIDKPLMKIEEIHKASDKAMKNIEILQNYQLDKTGRVDLALYDSGARIAGVGVTEMFYSCNIFWKFLGCPGKYQGPEMAIKSSMNYEDCFRFKNANGSLYIRLAKPAIVNAVTVEHITKQMSLTGQVTEAPRLLRVSVSFNIDRRAQLEIGPNSLVNSIPDFSFAFLVNAR